MSEISKTLERLELPELPAPLAGELIDAHTHLDTTQEYSMLRPVDALGAAAEVNVHRIVQIGCDVDSSQWAVRFASTHPQAVAAVAIHPNDAPGLSDEDYENSISTIDSLAGAGHHVRAVGETGLDYFRTDPTLDGGPEAIERQKDNFLRHIAIAKKHSLALAIHARRAESRKARKFGDALVDVADILDEVGWPERTIFHCFTGDPEFAKRALAAGAYLSFSGNVTYPANKHIYESLLLTPNNRIMVETDAPFLTPVPERGRKNASYLVPHTLRFVAQAKGLDEAQACAQLTANTVEAYGGEWGIGIEQD